MKSDLELYYAGTPITIRVLCKFWKYPKRDLSIFLHGAFMFLPTAHLNSPFDIENELDFLCQIVTLIRQSE